MSEWIKILDPESLEDITEEIPEIIRLDEIDAVFRGGDGQWRVWTTKYNDTGKWHLTDGIIRTNPFSEAGGRG